MKTLYFFLLVIAINGCSQTHKKEQTISSLPSTHSLTLEEKPVSQKLRREEAANYYRAFLETAKPGPLYADAMRRLADLELQTGQEKSLSGKNTGIKASQKKISDAIRLYKAYLETYPNRKNNDLILYQLAKAYELKTDQDNLLTTLNTLITKYPDTKYEEEVQFRRGETYFVLGKYKDAEKAYSSILHKYPDSPYFEKALYKYGWTRFKQVYYPDATKAFIQLLDINHKQGKLLESGPSDNLSRSEKELINDVLRVVSLSFSYQQGHFSITEFFKTNGSRPFEAMIYKNLAALYLEKQRIRDAAKTYLAYSDVYSDSFLAAQFYEYAIKAYETGGFSSLVLGTKIAFVNNFNISSPYWHQQNEHTKNKLKPLLKKHIKELATHYHAIARKNRNKADTHKAIKWYKTYITSFPDAQETASLNFLLAEANQDINQFETAIYEFENTAYKYKPHNKQAAAAYAALLLYPQVERSSTAADKSIWQNKKINNSLRFSEAFPTHKHAVTVLANTAELLFSLGRYSQAITTASKISPSRTSNKKIILSILLVQAHSEFELKNYKKAEAAYKKLLAKIPAKSKLYKELTEKYAASIYKQAELEKSHNNLAVAAALFLRIGNETPSSTLRANAEYDAASIYIELDKWDEAKNILVKFRKHFPAKHSLQQGVTEKLAHIYIKTNEPIKSAKEIEALAANKKKYTKTQRQELYWQAANIYLKHEKPGMATRLLKKIITLFPEPVEQAVEARALLASLHEKTDKRKHYYWLREIIKTDNKSGKKRTKRTIYLAADAHLKLTRPLFDAYKSAKLTTPLKKSLKKKKKLMKDVITAYQNTMKYKIPEFSTAATYYIAETYNDFARSLLSSKRPKKLSAEELEQYNILLEEQAFPFEEKAIDIHTANADRIKDKIYDQWVKSSIKSLAELNPVRYAKFEKHEDYLEPENAN